MTSEVRARGRKFWKRDWTDIKWTMEQWTVFDSIESINFDERRPFVSGSPVNLLVRKRVNTIDNLFDLLLVTIKL